VTRTLPLRRRPRSALAIALPALVFGAALAGEAAASPVVLPSGGKVVAGKATIGSTAGFSLTIDQSSSKAVIDWSSFSIGQGEKVTFDNGSGVTLNRVMSGQVSAIDGTLSATGGVYILNPNGVVIGKSGVVNVGGDFVASSLALSNQAFLAGGDLTFTGASAGPVTNLGYIVSSSGSLALIGPSVANAGQMKAAQGDVGLAAGETVMLHARDANDGRLSVLVGGAGTSATNSGLIQSAEAELKANGGDIYALAVNPGTGIEASGVSSKDGDVWLIASGGEVTATGAIAAHHADGSGGLVETSGENVNFDGLKVNAGEWLVDPVNLTLDAAAANTISTNLATTNVVLQTTATSASGPGVQSSGAGDIIVAAPISWTSGKSLTLDAYHSIAFDAGVTVAGGGQVILKTNDGGTGGGYSFAPGDSLVFAAGTGNGIAGQGLTINGQAFTLIYTEAQLAAVNGDLAGDFALAGPLSLRGFVFTDAPIAHDVSNPFTGVFEGLGNSISNLAVDQTIADPQTLGGLTWQGSVGLFGVIGAGGVVRDLSVANAYVSGGDNMRVGALAGVVLGAALNDSSSGDVSVGDTLDPTALDAAEAGGLVGSVRQGGQVLDSQSSADVTGGSAIVGGLVGAEADSASLISGSSASGVVTAGASTAQQTAIGGGLAGEIAGQASDDYATAKVDGGAGSWVGGLAGYVNGGALSESYASGAVAGLSGASASSEALVGGFAGNIDDGSTVTDAYSLGAVTLTGGVYARVGGFAGAVAGNSTASYVYATGAVSAATGARVGGLVGQVGSTTDSAGTGGTVTDGYWDEGTTGQTRGYTLVGAGAATSVSAVDAAAGAAAPSPYEKASYAGFDFTSAWYLIPGETRPILRSEYSTNIVNAHQLQLMALDPSASYTLAADIDASETASASGVWNPANGFVPVGGNGAAAFTGVFEGAGHLILNLDIDFTTAVSQSAPDGSTTDGMVGLFGEVGTAGTVRDVTLSNALVTGGNGMDVGGLVGLDEGAITNATFNGSVRGGAGSSSLDAAVGGLAGEVIFGAITDSSASSTVAGGANAWAGGLVGALLGGASINGSQASGAVSVGDSPAGPQASAGGLVGLMHGYDGATSDPDSVTGSYATGAVTGGASAWTGGLVGFLENGGVTTSYATGSVTLTAGSSSSIVSAVGGFVGGMISGSISQSWSSGAVTAPGAAGSGDGATMVGGFAGYIDPNSSVSYAYSLSPVTTTGTAFALAGGFAGYLAGSVSQFYATGLVTGSGPSGALVGTLPEGGSASDGYFDIGTTGQSSAVAVGGGVQNNLVPVDFPDGPGAYAQSTYANFDFSTEWYIVDGQTRPILRSEYSTTITDAHQLELMALDLGADYTLANNIDANETSSAYGVWNPANGFVPVGTAAAPFTGALNGQGFTLSNLNIVVAPAAAQTFEGLTTDGFAGLFGVVDGPSAVIENINLANVTVSGGEGVEVGALAGAFLQGTIESATSSGMVTGGDALIDGSGNRINVAVGGLVGLMGSQSTTGAAASIVDSSSAANVSAGDAFVGGLVGSTLTGSSITGSSASGTVAVGATAGTAGEIAVGGGLVGSAEGAALSNDYATGAVSGLGGSAVGGFAGYVGDSQVSASYATGAVSQSATSFAFSNYAGGFAGYVDTGSTVTTSFASGAVTSAGDSSSPASFAGGFAGYVNGSISQAYATGAAVSTGPADNVGGFAGEIDSGGSVNQVYATGAVTGAGSVGGLAGQLAGALSNSYWDEGTTGQTTGYVSAGGVATTVVGVGGATGVSPYEAATYAGWDFTHTWSMPSAGEYPELLGVSHVLEVVGGATTSVYGEYPVYAYEILGVQDADIQYTNPIAEAPSGVANSTSGWINVGTYVLAPSNLTATGGSGAYRSIYVAGSLTVTPAPITVTLTGVVDKTYDGTTVATISGSNLNLSGLIAGDVVTGAAGSAAYATKNAGAGIEVTASGVQLTGADAANYTVNTTASGAVGQIDPKTLTVTLVGTVDKTYDGTTAATLAGSDYQLTGVVSGDTVSLNDPTAGTYATKNAGTGIAVSVGGLALSGADANNYTVATTAAGAIGQIDPKVLTVTLSGTVEKTYDGSTSATLAASNYGLSGVIGGDSVSLNDPTAGTYATKNAGSGIAVTAGGLGLTGVDAGDYTVAKSASADIGKIDPKALTASLVGTVSKVYDGTTIATLAASNYELSGLISGDTVSLNDPATGAYASSQVGTGIKVTATGLALSGAAAGDYTVNSKASAAIGVITSAGVTPPPPTVTPGQVEIQVISPTQVDTISQPLTPPEDLAAEAGGTGQGANPTAYTVFPLSPGAAAAVGEASPVTGAGNGDLWAGSNLDPDQTCPPDKKDCPKGAPNR
jgi:filamentous hemagglutinin family protein